MTPESDPNASHAVETETAVGDAPVSESVPHAQSEATTPVSPPLAPSADCAKMAPTLNVLTLLRERFREVSPEGTDPDSFTRAIKESGGSAVKLGDYQANGCMAAAKAAGVNPRDLAATIAERVDLAPLADRPEVAGPGFLNITLATPFLAETLKHRLVSGRLLDERPASPRTIIVDFSSPNVAKPMHVGHLRSTVIGDALARIFEALGHKVWRDNHLGDWGAQFGMILWGYRHLRNPIAYAKTPVRELARLYRKVNDLGKPAEELGDKLEKVLKLLDEGRREDAARLVPLPPRPGGDLSASRHPLRHPVGRKLLRPDARRRGGGSASQGVGGRERGSPGGVQRRVPRAVLDPEAGRSLQLRHHRPRHD